MEPAYATIPLSSKTRRRPSCAALRTAEGLTCSSTEEVDGTGLTLVVVRCEGAVPSLLRRLLGTISDSAIDLGHGEYHITTSIGTVLLPDGVPDDGGFELALSIADDALYTAKHAGRDRACLILSSGETLTLGGRRAGMITRRDESIGARTDATFNSDDL